MLRSRHKLIGVAVAVAFIAMGCSSSKKASSGPTTTSNGSTTSGAPTTAPSGAESGKTPVNIKASQAVKNDPLTGTPGSGLTQG